MTVAIHPEYQLTYAAIRPLGENDTLLETLAGELFEIECPPDVCRALLEALSDGEALQRLLQTNEHAAALNTLLQGLREEGIVQEVSDGKNETPPHPLHQINEIVFCNASQTEIALTDWLTTELPVINVVFGDLQQQLDKPEQLLIFIADGMDHQRFQEIDQHCCKHGIAWCSFHVDLGRGWLGPLVIPGQTANYRDLLQRRRCSGDAVETAQLNAPIPVFAQKRGSISPAAYRWMTGLFFAEIDRALNGQSCRLLSSELCADPITLTTQSYAFLPMPTRPLPDRYLTSAATLREQLINPRSGVILAQHQVDHHPSIPRSLITVQSHCCDISRVCDWQNDSFVGGSAFDNWDAASGASTGEAVERYCGNFIPSLKPRKASYNQLIAAGEQALDPKQMILHSEAMLAQKGCPFTPFTRDLEVLWVPGESITHQRKTWLPLSLVFANWITPQTQYEPVTHHLWTPGMAGGRNLEEALVGAIREIIERDITMAWWLNAVQLPSMKLTPDLHALFQESEATRKQSYRLIHLDNPFNVPVMVGIVEDREQQLINIGFGCRPDPMEAAKKAWTEALTLQEGSRDLLLRDSVQRQSAEDWGMLHVPYKPWREDRRYLDDFDPQFRDVSDLMVQPQVFLDPRAVEQVRPILDTSETRSFDTLASLPDNRFETYRKRVEAQGFEILYADITSPDIALTGMRAVRVIIPGLIPNMAAAFPAVGGARVFQLPVAMGWRQTPKTEASLNFFPMPHA